MNIEQIDTSKILISLCDKEMKEYNVSYEALGLRDLHARRVIHDLLSRAEHKTGMELHGKRLVIEAMKYDHGCLLLVTVEHSVPRRVYRIKSRSSSYAFRFHNVEELLSCIEQLYRYNSGIKSTLLADDNYYYLVMPRLMSDDRILRIISEYTNYAVKGIFAALSLKEHTNTLSSPHAISEIGKRLVRLKGEG